MQKYTKVIHTDSIVNIQLYNFLYTIFLTFNEEKIYSNQVLALITNFMIWNCFR